VAHYITCDRNVTVKYTVSCLHFIWYSSFKFNQFWIWLTVSISINQCINSAFPVRWCNDRSSCTHVGITQHPLIAAQQMSSDSNSATCVVLEVFLCFGTAVPAMTLHRNSVSIAWGYVLLYNYCCCVYVVCSLILIAVTSDLIANVRVVCIPAVINNNNNNNNNQCIYNVPH